MKSVAQLKQDVREELKWEPAVSAELIGVEVKEGIVTLAGHVNSFPESGMPNKLPSGLPVSRR